MFRTVLIATSALALSACATTYSLQPVASSSHQVTYNQGSAEVMSKKERSAVRVAPTSTAFEGRMSLGVVAFNDSPDRLNLGTENVKVYTAAGAPVRVMTYEALVKEAKNAAAWQAVAVALAAGANAYAANQPTTYNTYGSVYGRGGAVSYASTTSVYNPSSAAIANQLNTMQTQRSIEQIKGALDATLGSLGQSVLRTTTIEPGGAFGGNVIVEKPKFKKGEEQALKVVVDIAGEQHEFRFAVAPS